MEHMIFAIYLVIGLFVSLKFINIKIDNDITIEDGMVCILMLIYCICWPAVLLYKLVKKIIE